MCIESFKKANEIYPLEDMRHGIVHVQITTEHVMEEMAATQMVVSAEFVEVNPVLDVRSQTARMAVELMARLLGDTIF